MLYGCDNPDAQLQDLRESQASAQQTLESRGAKISERNLPAPIGTLTTLDLTGLDSITDESIDLIGRMGRRVAELKLNGTNIRDEQMSKLNSSAGLMTLVKLDLSDTGITDKGLAEIRDLSFLGELTLKNTRVTDDGVKALQKLRTENPKIQVKQLKVKR
ncbi:MAG: hypothetical protein ACT4QC_03040 [Planctomycetaceae bacterium]